MRKPKQILFFLTFIIQFHGFCQQIDGSFNKQYLKKWKMESSLKIHSDDKAVSLKNFDQTKWLDVEVPTTVLRALVKAGIYPDPHFDLNNFLIPDASDSLNTKLDLGKYSYIKDYVNPFKSPYWFSTRFTIPENKKNQKIWLNFDGINYRADVWINGNKIADSADMVGMFTRFKFDITPYVNLGSENILAVKIYQVDHIGTADPGYQFEVFGPQRGWGEDIFKDATLKFSAGWDCAPVVRDRNMGIYQEVYLSYTGVVEIIDPYVISDLPLPDTTSALLTISAELKNNSNKPVKGLLKGTIKLMNEVDFFTYKKIMPGNMKPIRFEKEIEIEAGEMVTVTLSTSDFSQLNINHPYLWWPNGYGNQYLHNLTLSFETDMVISDTKNTLFGIREITNTLKEINDEYGRVFWVNGKKIFARGGWLQPDMMLDMNKKRMYDEARLLACSNVNMIACEDMPSPPEYVMETYDKYGLLMWETFFQCWTSYPGTESFANPADANLAVTNAYDIIKRYRSHPSLVMWTLQCETIVRDEIYTPVRNYVKQMDTTRPFVPTSSIDWDVDSLTPYMKPDLPLGITDDGAPDYTWYPHGYYYNKILEVKQQMFRDELGVPSVPVYSSMKKFIFNLGDEPHDSIYPLDKNWAHHGAWDDGGYVYKAYDVAIRQRYGFPKTVQDYIREAQYVNAGSYRAMFEAANHRMWDITSGVMLWKLNSAWPTVVWQIYDWFLNPTSAYYFTKKALEPLHIQLNENNFTVSVINTNHNAFSNLHASVKVYNFNLTEKWSKQEVFNINENCYRELFTLPKIKNLSETYFVRLILTDNFGKTVSDNFYWLSSKTKPDFSDLNTLTQVNLTIKTTIKEERKELVITVKIKNPSKKLAFMNRLMITKDKGGDEVLPTFWDDNFFTLLPGEEKILTARVAKSDLDGKPPVVAIDRTIY